MANAAGYNPSDKDSHVALSSSTYYLGANSIATDSTADSNNYSARSTWSASTGKWILLFVPSFQTGANKNSGPVFGVGNGSASLTNYVGSSANSWGINSATILNNGAVTYTINGAAFYAGANPLYAIALNLDASPKRIHFRQVSNNAAANPRADTGWINGSGAASDPTNNSSGTDISALGTPLYAMTSLVNNGNVCIVTMNLGGWPPLTDLVPIPSGYSMPDANYPLTMPSGVFTLSGNTNPSGLLISQNNMRATAASGSGTNSVAYSSQFPASSKTINATYWDMAWLAASVGHGFTGDGSYTNAMLWNNDGTTRNMGGVSGPIWSAGYTTYTAVDRSNNRAWITIDGGTTWYGNGGASPNPATNTNGVDISGAVGLSTLAPAMFLSTDTRGAGTWNAGRLTDAFSVPSGFRWLDVPPLGYSFGGIIGL